MHKQELLKMLICKSINKNDFRNLMAFLTPTLIILSNLIFITPDTSATPFSASITTSGAKSINVAPSSDGAGTSISADDITVTTTCRSGYNLTLSTSVNDNNLYLDGDVANNTSGTYFTPASGSTSLSESPNTWGYVMESPTASSTFNAVPTLSNPATIKTPLTTPSTTDITDEFSVYYGVAVSSSVTPGTYKMIPDTNNSNNDGTIVYRLTMADECIAYTVNFSPTSTFEGNQLTGTGTVSSQTIYEGVATNLTSAKFTAPSGYYFAGWNTEPDGTGTQYSSGQSVTDLASVGETLTLYAMWTDCPAKKICYDKNITTAYGTMSNQTVSSNNEYTLYPSNFSAEDPASNNFPGDYGFIGWSTEKLDPDDTDFRTDLAEAVSAHKVYGPNETITLGDTSSGGLKLYAVWMPVAKDDNDTELTFQTANLLTTTLADTDDGTTLSAKPNGYVTALRDQRDNQVYAIAKLADGKYWMIENLRLENTAAHNSDGSLAQGYDSSFIGLADPEAPWENQSTATNSLYSTDGSTLMTISGDGSRFPRYNNSNTSARATNASKGQNIYSYGNYYTWAAAIADTTAHTSNNVSVTSTSLCPAGWHLPKGGDKSNEANNEFWALIVTGINNGKKPSSYNNAAWPAYDGMVEGSIVSELTRTYPNNFILSGESGHNSVKDRGSTGYYSSSTPSSTGSEYDHDMYLRDDLVSPGTHGGSVKYYGKSIRCLAGS